MSEKRRNLLGEDLRSVVELLQSSGADGDSGLPGFPPSTPSPRFVLSEVEDLAVRFLFVADDKEFPTIGAGTKIGDNDGDHVNNADVAEYTLSCCLDEYPCNTVVSCSLEPNDMKIVDYDILTVVKELREMALTTNAPPLPSALGGSQSNRRRSIANSTPSMTDESPFTRDHKKIRFYSHPEKLAGS